MCRFECFDYPHQVRLCLPRDPAEYEFIKNDSIHYVAVPGELQATIPICLAIDSPQFSSKTQIAELRTTGSGISGVSCGKLAAFGPPYPTTTATYCLPFAI